MGTILIHVDVDTRLILARFLAFEVIDVTIQQVLRFTSQVSAHLVDRDGNVLQMPRINQMVFRFG